MKRGYNSLPNIWRTGELDPGTAEYVKEQLAHVPNLTVALRELAVDLTVGDSRTIRELPVNNITEDIPGAVAQRCSAQNAY